MPSVFISYSHEDDDIAKLIKRKLVESKSKVFLSGENIEPGDDWEDTIWNNLEESDTFIFIASKQSVIAEYPKYEIGGAFYDEKDIIPILIDVSPEELPSIVKRFQALDFRNKTVNDIEYLITGQGKAIRRHEFTSGLKLVSAIFGTFWILSKWDE